MMFINHYLAFDYFSSVWYPFSEVQFTVVAFLLFVLNYMYIQCSMYMHVCACNPSLNSQPSQPKSCTQSPQALWPAVMVARRDSGEFEKINFF